MERRYILVLVLLGLFCNGCIYYDLYFNRNYYRPEQGASSRPILPHFRLAKPEPYRLKTEDLIDTTVIYVRKYKILEEDEIYFLRFFGNGRVASGFLTKDSLSYNNIKRSVAGYYRMRSPMELELQQFLAYSITHASYEYSRGIIRGDTIFLFPYAKKKEKLPEPLINNGEWKGKKNSNCAIYIKQKVDTLTGTPDW